MRPALISLILATVIATAQQQPASAQPRSAKQFEVASMKEAGPFVPGTTRASLTINGTHLDIHSYTLSGLLNYIYNPQSGRFVAPDWTRDINLRFDIQAVVPAGSTKADVRAMLEALLIERLRLKMHVEPRVIRAFDLVVAPGGTKMRTVDEINELDAELKDLKPEQYTVDSKSPDGESRTITSLNTGVRTINARSNYVIVAFPNASQPTKYVLDATRITMGEFAQLLSGRVDRPVIDATNLAGVYQFKIDIPQLYGMGAAMQRAGLTTNVRGEPIDFDSASNINVPKQVETLGLLLVERRTPVDVIVIDSVNRTPTEN